MKYALNPHCRACLDFFQNSTQPFPNLVKLDKFYDNSYLQLKIWLLLFLYNLLKLPNYQTTKVSPPKGSTLFPELKYSLVGEFKYCS